MTHTRMATRSRKSTYLIRWTPELVAEAEDKPMAFAEYAQQILGVPYPTVKDMTVLRKRIKQFFEYYPRANYFTLCRIVSYCKTRRRRYAKTFMLLEEYRNAWVDGCLPELDPQETDEELEAAIAAALEVEERTSWRTRLIGAGGLTARRKAYEEWQQSR